MTGKSTGFVAAFAAALLLAAAPASAACFELVGCTDSQYMSTAKLKQLSCDALFTVRNTIYHENGYCFHTAKAKAVFSNQGCFISNQANVPLNAFERDNAARVAQVERQKGC